MFKTFKIFKCSDASFCLNISMSLAVSSFKTSINSLKNTLLSVKISLGAYAYHLGSATDDNPLAVLASQNNGGSPRVVYTLLILQMCQKWRHFTKSVSNAVFQVFSFSFGYISLV